ncbi:hypothetical protein PO909_030054 [Leuciscus waleckii]
MLSEHFDILRKHINLSTLSQNHIRALCNCSGWTLGHVEGGYFLNISVVPKKNGTIDDMFIDKHTAKVKTSDILNAVVAHFKCALRTMAPRNMDRPSMLKANFHDVSRFNVLDGDQGFAFMLLQRSISEVTKGLNIDVMLTLSMFGQKSEDMIDYSGFVDTNYIVSVSLHTACNIHAKDPRIHLMWSRYGVQEVVGNIGSLFSAVCMNEAANFSSNLDHRGLDIFRALRGVFKEVDLGYTLTFVQMYATTPHSKSEQMQAVKRKRRTRDVGPAAPCAICRLMTVGTPPLRRVEVRQMITATVILQSVLRSVYHETVRRLTEECTALRSEVSSGGSRSDR